MANPGGSGGKGGFGGSGAGGGLLLHCPGVYDITGELDLRGGNDLTVNGGTLKVFYLGGMPSGLGTKYGRLYTKSLGLPGGDGGSGG